jgi:ABC-type multidrug transport system fused ATPase/permease subunit
MINGIVRSPGSFFDTTPSGMLINKFSNDLGILDNSLSMALVEMVEGPALSLVALVNICQIDLYFIPPAVVVVICIFLFVRYARPAIIQCKQKDLKNKSPIFNFYSETLNGLVQIRIYGRRKHLISKFTRIINSSTKASIAFDIVSRGFGFYVFFLGGTLLMAIGMEVGIQQTSSINSGLYAVTVIFLVQFSELLQWFLRQTIAVESLMLSSERAFQIIDLPSEKALRTQYDN